MFKVGLTRDFLTPEGLLCYKDIGLHILKDAGVYYEFLKEHRSPITPDVIDDYDAIISLAPAYTQESFIGVNRLKAICRFGVGYDMVDIGACTKAGVMVTVTKGAVNYSVAEAIVTWMLALSHKVIEKNKLTKSGGWAQRNRFMGSELRGRTLGIIGLGGIGSHLIELLKPFRISLVLAFDPYTPEEVAQKKGAQLVDLNTLFRYSDFVSINCPLNEETRNLIGEKELALAKDGVFIINTARGGIINENALLKYLKQGVIAGYATDVFDKEPPETTDPLLKADNVISAPHCIAWTDDLFKEIGYMACEQVVEISQGKIPEHTLNKAHFISTSQI